MTKKKTEPTQKDYIVGIIMAWKIKGEEMSVQDFGDYLEARWEQIGLEIIKKQEI